MSSIGRHRVCLWSAAAVLSMVLAVLPALSASAATPPPVVVSSSATPSPVNAGSNVTFTWQFTSQAGVNFATIFASGPNGSVLPNCGGPGLPLASGTPNAGTYQLVCAVPTTAANGTWTTGIHMEDAAGNVLSRAGPSFIVTGGTSATPPVVVSSSATPSPVNAGSNVTFTWQFTSQAGVNFATIFASGPNGSVLPNCGGPGLPLASGTPNAGTYQLVCAVPTTAANGTWTTGIHMEDAAGNVLSRAGPSFIVTGGTSATPPVVVSSSATPSPVNAGSNVTFTWQFTSQAGVNFATIFASGPNGSVLPNCGGPGLPLASGTPNAGTYQLVCAVPTTAANGTWTTGIHMEDAAGNVLSRAGPSFIVGAQTIPSVSPTASTYGDRVTYEARVVVEAGTPTGTVSFRARGVPLCTTPPLSSGTASCVANAAPGGLNQVTATYSGDATFGPAAGTTTLAVFKAASSTSIAVSPTNVAFGRSVTYSAKVSSAAGEPTGSVTFTSKGAQLCTANVDNGRAGCTASTAPPGNNAVTATFSGNGNVDGSAATAATAVRSGYWMVASDGGVFAFGDAGFHGSMGGHPLNEPIAGIAPTPDGNGYWMVASDGGVFAFGDAGFHGSMGGHPLNEPIAGIAPTPDGNGYWMVASDGGVFAFGDAGFHGSMGGHPLNEPIAGIAPTPDGNGYWMVASDGGVFAFGDAGFYGSDVGQQTSGSFVGIAPSGTGGYWLASSSGSVFAHGAATDFGSIAPGLMAPMTGIAPVPNGSGYVSTTASGGLFVFGQAPYEGSLADRTLSAPVVGIASL